MPSQRAIIVSVLVLAAPAAAQSIPGDTAQEASPATSLRAGSVAAVRAADGARSGPSDYTDRRDVVTDTLLGPGSHLRVTYCEAGCKHPRLTATGILAGLGDGSLRMQTDTRLEVRVMRDGVAKKYEVVELGEAAVWIDAPEPTLVLIQSGWTADPDGLVIPIPQATRLETRVRRFWVGGALRGAFLGGTIPAIALGALAAASTPRDSFFGPAFAAYYIGSMALVVGAPIGGLIGAIYPGNRWVDASDRLPAPTAGTPGPP